MKYKSIIVVLGLLCGGCATMAPPTGVDLAGEWRFTYVQKAQTLFGMNPSPPLFDVLDFRSDGSVRLVDSMRRREFPGTYTVAGNKLTWRFSPPDVKQPIEHRLECSWAEGGQAVVLRIAEGEEGSSSETEWVYYRPARLLPNDSIIGKWAATFNGESGDMTFEQDGRYYMDGRKVWGYYRLWPSRYGNALTTPIWIQGEGAFMLLYTYKVDADQLILTPVTWNGLEKKGAVVWKRAKAEAPSKGSERDSGKAAADGGPAGAVQP